MSRSPSQLNTTVSTTVPSGPSASCRYAGRRRRTGRSSADVGCGRDQLVGSVISVLPDRRLARQTPGGPGRQPALPVVAESDLAHPADQGAGVRRVELTGWPSTALTALTPAAAMRPPLLYAYVSVQRAARTAVTRRRPSRSKVRSSPVNGSRTPQRAPSAAYRKPSGHADVAVARSPTVTGNRPDELADQPVRAVEFLMQPARGAEETLSLPPGDVVAEFHRLPAGGQTRRSAGRIKRPLREHAARRLPEMCVDRRHRPGTARSGRRSSRR